MKIFVIIPTYNEAVNMEELISRILKLNIKDLYILVVDDNSPDGTADIVANFSEKDKRVLLLKRYKKRGRGSAGTNGFKYALNAGADYIIEMDGDFSHNPKYIPDFIKAIKDNDVVLGSRFIKGGCDVGRGLKRR
ncbi:MAG: glycosyltransferase, partial [Candidatus Omnitrophica bacterium]|nr:glycosyltransferase [Candidatus Omnitrophota bacterium]